MGFRGSAKGTVGGILKIIGNGVPGGPVIPLGTVCLRFSASPCEHFVTSSSSRQRIGCRAVDAQRGHGVA
jgi:hypothetical protein